MPGLLAPLSRWDAADLSGAQLPRAELNDVSMVDAVLRSAELTGCELRNGQLAGASFMEATAALRHARAAGLVPGKQPGAPGASCWWMAISNTTLLSTIEGRWAAVGPGAMPQVMRRAKMPGADLSKATRLFEPWRLKPWNCKERWARGRLSGATLPAAKLVAAQLQQADLQEAQLQDAKLLRADLSEADLTSANLVGIDLRQSVCNGAIFQQAQMSLGLRSRRSSNLDSAKLASASLEKAIVSTWAATVVAMAGSARSAAELQQTSTARATVI
eukprot:Skav228545  [mRNA]  locus=scaffold1887:444180:454228:+ [translate_table: standard]